MLVKKQQLEPGVEQGTGSKLEKEYVKAVYHHPAYLTFIQSTSCEMPGWMRLKLQSKKKKRTPTVAHVLPLRDGIPYTYTHMGILGCLFIYKKDRIPSRKLEIAREHFMQRWA